MKRAFRYALTRLKPIDGIIVGMFPWAFDEIGANAGYTASLGAAAVETGDGREGVGCAGSGP